MIIFLSQFLELEIHLRIEILCVMPCKNRHSACLDHFSHSIENGEEPQLFSIIAIKDVYNDKASSPADPTSLCKARLIERIAVLFERQNS